MKLSVCIDAVFSGFDPIEAVRKTARSGFKAIEFWSYGNKDLDKLGEVCLELGVTVAGFCPPSGDLNDPAKRHEYLEGLKAAVSIANKLNCKTLITQVGQELAGVPRSIQHQSIVDGLKSAAKVLEGTGITLVFEPLNTRINHSGYYLSESAEAFQIAQEVGNPQIKVLFDIYHQQVTEGDVTRRAIENIEQIGHMHCAGNPGRHELDLGELNYREIFDTLIKAGYRGYMGFEYFPQGDPEASLAGWKKYV